MVFYDLENNAMIHTTFVTIGIQYPTTSKMLNATGPFDTSNLGFLTPNKRTKHLTFFPFTKNTSLEVFTISHESNNERHKRSANNEALARGVASYLNKSMT